MDRVEILQPDNWHCHLREEEMMSWMVGQVLDNGFLGRVLVMPNTRSPVLTGSNAQFYRDQIVKEIGYDRHGRIFEPVMTIQITEATSPELIRVAFQEGNAKVAKVYPRYVTTNSENGVVDYKKIYNALSEAQNLGMIVCFHPEHPSYEVEGLLKEDAFLKILEDIRLVFPRLKIVVEHVTTAAMAIWVYCQPVSVVAATITPHHAFITLDDVLGYSESSGGKMCIHNGCKPQAKWRADRDFLVRTILEGDRHFFYGGDDAPHLKESKYGGACGVFNTPVSLPLLIQLAVENDSLEQLQKFLSVNGATFYGYPIADEHITFVREDWQVPAEYEVPGTGSSVVPFMAGKTMNWKLVV